MKEVPGEIYFECPDCDDVTIHGVLSGKMGKSSLDATIKCQDCGLTRTTTVRFPKKVEVNMIVSDGAYSLTTKLLLEDDDLLKIGDEFHADDGGLVKISGLELPRGRRVKTARATEITTVWAIKFDVIDIKVSINDDRRTYSKTVPSSPDDEFTIGDVLSFDDMDCLVHSIKIKDRMVRRGTVEARDITRIYGKFRKRSYAVLDLGDEN
ncbi:MAG: hypothetical protein LBI08_03845 [Methanomassiliicoccaceae archaeon]|jgi:uncharacterized Zn finger protein|nr:hypothetical protein [Methanomassiliicoccaceae archaeon]